MNGLTDFQFRLWAYLITYVDDYGRGSADPELLKGFVFPRRRSVTESTIAKGLTDLAAAGLIHLYTVDGDSYLCFPTWTEHQRIQNKKSRFPAPETDSSPSVTVSHGESPSVTVSHGESPSVTVGHGESPPESESNPNPKEREGAARFTPPTVEEVGTYCRSRQNGIDPEKFVDFYTSKDWFIGKNKMKDWKSAVRTWEKRDAEENPQPERRFFDD